MIPRYRIVALVATVVLLATSSPASACSCFRGDPRDALEQADAAIIGTLLSRAPAGQGSARFTFRVDEEIKGDFNQTVEIGSADNGAACGLEVGVGQQTGLFLSRNDAGGWSSSLCQQISPDELREAAALVPAPDGEGPIKMIAGGNWGAMGLFALDSEGRTLMYGKRAGGSSVADVCPGSSLFIETPWTGSRRWVVRRTSTFEIVDVVHPPRGAWPAKCLAQDASEVLVFAIRYGEPLSKSRLYWYHEGNFDLLYSGTSSGFEAVGDHIYLTEGRYGRNVRVLDLATGTKTFIARLPRYVQGVTASSDEIRLVTTSGANREKLVVIDRSTTPATVRLKDLGVGMSGDVYWLNSDRFVYLPGGYDNSRIKIFDSDLNLERRLEGNWYSSDEEIVEGVAYGIGWGALYRAELSNGPAEVLREFPSPEIYSIAVVPDEVHAQNP